MVMEMIVHEKWFVYHYKKSWNFALFPHTILKRKRVCFNLISYDGAESTPSIFHTKIEFEQQQKWIFIYLYQSWKNIQQIPLKHIFWRALFLKNLLKYTETTIEYSVLFDGVVKVSRE